MEEDKIIQYETIMAQHKQSLADLEAMLADLDVKAITERNAALIEEVSDLKASVEVLKKSQALLKTEYTDVKLALTAQIMSEKMSYISGSKNRIQTLFQSSEVKSANHLETLEKQMLDYIKTCEQKTLSLKTEIADQYRSELKDIGNRIKPDFIAAQQRIAKDYEDVAQSMHAAYDGDQLKAIDSGVLEKTVTRKSFEFKWGLNVLNKIGVLLILLAVVMAGQYTYKNFFGDYAKAITFYSIGAILLVVGEYFNRKKYTTLAMALIGGGIGVLYSATFISTFYLDVIGLWPALGISVGVAVFSTFLASTYKSQTLGALSLVGGYLPVFAYVVVEGIDTLPVFGAIAYLMVLNAVILALSIKNRWQIVVMIGFAFNLICVDALVLKLDNTAQGIGVVFVNFATYLCIVLYRNIKRNEAINVWDVVLMSLNTLGHVSMIYFLLNKTEPSEMNGLIAVAFGALYLGLGIWLKKRNVQAQLVNLFFLLSGLFSVLVIPLQFDLEWWFFGWLLEAILFIAWGRKEQMRIAERGGWVLFLLSFCTFTLSNMAILSFAREFPSVADAKYLGMVLASCGIVWLYREVIGIDDGLKGEYVRIFRVMTLSYLIIFLFIEGVMLYDLVAPNMSMVEIVSVLVLVIVSTLKVAGTFQWHQWIQLSKYKLIVYGIGTVLAILSNLMYQEPSGIRWALEIFLLIGINYFAMTTINLYMKHPSVKEALPKTIRSLVIAIYVLVAYYVNFMLRVTSSYDDLLLNISLILFSIGYIVLGFAKKDSSLRKVGLVVSFIATAKLLIIDSMQLPLGQKIFSYLAFGVTLIAISYVYQRVNSKLIDLEKVQGDHDEA